MPRDPDWRTTSGVFARLEALASDEAAREGGRQATLLESIGRLKEQILEKDRLITERTAALVGARDYLKQVFAALADAVLVLDAEGRVEFANAAAADLLGWRQDELRGREARALLASPEQAERLDPARLSEVLAAGALERTDLLLRARHGPPIPVSWSSTVLRVGDQPAGLVVVARDVRVERRLQDEKVRAVQALAASVAHEIRNPLGAIQSSVALLLRDLAVEGEDRTLLEIVERETRRIGGIVEQFLDFARPPRPLLEPVDLAEALAEVVALAERDERAADGRRALLLHVDPGLPPAEADPAQLRQVVWNLVLNALDAARSSVAVRARQASGGRLEVRVSDDGPGIPPEVLARACEPFLTTKAQGTGLGLAICKRLVEAHGGALRLESAPGGGAVASFTLAAASA